MNNRLVGKVLTTKGSYASIVDTVKRRHGLIGFANYGYLSLYNIQSKRHSWQNKEQTYSPGPEFQNSRALQPQ